MSVVCRTPQGAVVVYSKGADNVMYQRAKGFVEVAGKDNPENRTPSDVMNGQLEAFGGEGLRTLVLAKRELSAAQYEVFAAKVRRMCGESVHYMFIHTKTACTQPF